MQCPRCGISYTISEDRERFNSHFHYCYDYDIDLPERMCYMCARASIEDNAIEITWDFEDDSINPEDL